MGRDLSILAAAMRWSDLLAQLEGRAGDFTERGEVETECGGDSGVTCDRLSISAGELGGRAYVSESSSLLSGCEDPDLICEIAVESGRLVVGCGADAESGNCHLVVADGDGLRRCFHHRRNRLTRPFEWGEPIPTEAEYPLDGDNDALGLKMALRYCGFNPDVWAEKGAGEPMSFRARSHSDKDATAAGPLGRAIQGHYEWFRIQPPEKLSAQEAAASVAACEPVRGIRRSRSLHAVDRFFAWAAASRPSLLPRGVIGRSSVGRRDSGPWATGKEFS